MITSEINGVKMELSAGCYWGEWVDVAIIQKYHDVQLPSEQGVLRGTIQNCIELNIEQAEALVHELITAIVQAKVVDAEYQRDMEKDRKANQLDPELEAIFSNPIEPNASMM